MKDREFRKLKAGTAAGSPGGVWPGWGWRWPAVWPLARAGGRGETNSQAGQVVTAYLDYQEVNYSFHELGPCR